MSLPLCTFLSFLLSFPSLQIGLAAFPSRISQFLCSSSRLGNLYSLRISILEEYHSSSLLFPFSCPYLCCADYAFPFTLYKHLNINYINQDTCLLKAYFNEGTQNIPQSLRCMQKDNNSYLDVLIQSFTSICSFCLWRIRQERNFVENKGNENVSGK